MKITVWFEKFLPKSESDDQNGEFLQPRWTSETQLRLQPTFVLSCLLLAAVSFLLGGCAATASQRLTQVGSTKIAWLHTGTNSPTVVFQSGLGDGASPWASVIERLPETISTFAYDRPGYGSSEPIPDGSRNPCVIARELRETLRAIGLRPPYLLVGHSLGGQYQYAFAKLFPQEVAGMLLLDPTHPDHWSAMQRQAPGVAAVVSGLKIVAFSSVMRAEFNAQGSCLEPPRELQDRIPTRILVRTKFELFETPDFRSMVQALEQDWLRLIPGASRTLVEGSGHYIQKDEPNSVVAAIQSLLNEFHKPQR